MPRHLFESPGFLNVGVFGDNTDGQRITSNITTKRISPGTQTEDVEEEVDFSLYNQIVGELILLERTADEIDKKISEGKAEVDVKVQDAINTLTGKMNEATNTLVGKMNEAISNITNTTNGHINNINNVTNTNIDNINGIVNTGIRI